MPNAREIAMGRRTRLSAGLLLSVLTDAPLFSAFDVRTTQETEFLTLSLDRLPASAFMRLGQGFIPGQADLSIRKASCAVIGGMVSAEVNSANLWDAAHADSGVTYFGLQTSARFSADVLNVERQIIKGWANDVLGFPGARDICPYVSGNVFTLADTPDTWQYQRSVINAGAGVSLTPNTGSSVYAFRFGALESQLVMGNDTQGGELFRFNTPIEQYIADPNNAGAQLHVRQASFFGHVGLSVGGFSPTQVGEKVPAQFSARRITNLTADVGATLSSDLMSHLEHSFGPSKKPNLYAMSYRSGRQLAKNVSATSIVFNMGAGNAAQQAVSITPPPPETWNGVPIVYPQCIGSTDVIEA